MVENSYPVTGEGNVIKRYKRPLDDVNGGDNILLKDTPEIEAWVRFCVSFVRNSAAISTTAKNAIDSLHLFDNLFESIIQDTALHAYYRKRSVQMEEMTTSPTNLDLPLVNIHRPYSTTLIL